MATKNYNQMAFEKGMFRGFYRDEFREVFIDLLKRAEANVEPGEDISEAIWLAIDEGLIYTSDQWEVYRYYCDMGEEKEAMYDGLFSDIYMCLS